MLSPHVTVPLVVVALCGNVVASEMTKTNAEEGKRTFNLPSGDAAVTLKQFAATTDAPIIYLVDRVRGTTTNAVVGEYKPREALDRMLAGTALEAAQDVATGAFVVSRKRSADDASSAGKVGPESNLQPNPQPKARENTMKPSRKLIAAIAGWLALATGTSAQTAATPPTDEVIVLSPFIIDATTDKGYSATNTLGGTRLKAELKDVATQVDVMTSDFLNDINALTLDEALKYSLNIESFSDYASARDGQDDLNSVNVWGSQNGSRTRGLTRSNSTHDFFETNFPIDTYNTGSRITFVSGSNAILFGAGLAGGTTDVSYERPDLRRTRGKVTVRIDSEKSHRSSINVSVPLIKNVLALRAATLRFEDKDYRTRVGTTGERYFASINFQPHKKFNIHAWYEKLDYVFKQGPSTLTADYVSRWIKSGKPAFENLGVLSTSPSAAYNTAFGPSASLTSYTPLNNSATGNSLPTSASTYTSNVRVLGVFNSGAASSNVAPQLWAYNTVNPLSNNSAFYGQDPVTLGSLPVDGSRRLEYSITDSSIYPIDDSVTGDASQRQLTGSTKGGIFEFNPIKNIFIEGGYNREDMVIERFDLLTGNDADLKVDMNRYLPNLDSTGIQKLNPNFGKYYVEDSPNGAFWINRREDKRIQLAFGHDRAPSTSWRRWLGDHRGAVMYTESDNKRNQHTGSIPRIISSNVIPGITGAPAVQLLNPANEVNIGSRVPVIRYYLDPANGDTAIKMPFDPFKSNTFVMGKDANGADIVVSTGIDNPYGMTGSPGNGLKTEMATQGALSSSFFNNRIITTIGRRFSKATFSDLVLAPFMPRYNGVNGTYEVPVAGIFTSTGTAVPSGAGYSSAKRTFDDNSLYQAPRRYKTGSNLQSVVVHPFNWISFHYNKSSSNFVAEYTSFNVNGALANLDDGDTKEYGGSIYLFNNRLTLKYNHYKSVASGLFGEGVNVPNTGARLDSHNLRSTVVLIEKTVLASPIVGLGAAGIPTTDNPYSVFMNDLLTKPLSSNNGGDFDYGRFHDRAAEGDEFAITANPTPNWTIRATFAKNKTSMSNIAGEWFNYINFRLPAWKAFAAANPTIMTFATSGTSSIPTFQEYTSLASRTWMFLKQSEGLPTTQEAKYRARFNTRYSFSEGKLKGLSAGAGARYDSARSIGYFQKPIGTDSPYFPIIDGSLTLPDQSKPIMGKARLIFDGFINYKMKVSKNIKWNIGLNISNLLGNNELIPQDAFVQADGTVANIRFGLPQPRTFSLTNSFEF